MEEGPLRGWPEETDRVVAIRAGSRVGVVRLAESLDEIEETSGDAGLFFWIIGILFFGLGDTISSFLVFAQGGVEVNPFMQWALTLPGGLLAFVFVKVFALSALYLICYLWEGPQRWFIPLLMAGAGVYLTTHNLLQYLGIA